MSSDKIAMSDKDLFEQDEPDMSPFESFWQSHHGPDFNPYDWAQDFNRFDDAKNESKRAWEHSESEIKSLQSKLAAALKIGNELADENAKRWHKASQDFCNDAFRYSGYSKFRHDCIEKQKLLKELEQGNE